MSLDPTLNDELANHKGVHDVENDSDPEGEEGNIEEGSEEEEDEDFLEDFPDDTTVSLAILDDNPLIALFLLLQELELLHSRLTSLKCLRLSRFAQHLKKLGLRQNLVSFLDPNVFCLLTNLEELDLYDNRIKTVGDALTNLTTLA
jgi:protein phosphatase 1 regulatory subunit 7